MSVKKQVAYSLFKCLIMPILIVGACILLLPKLIGFLLPFLIGWMIAYLASPLVKFIENKLKIHRKAGAAFVISISIALIIFVIYLILEILITQTISFAKTIPDMTLSVSSAFNEIKGCVDGFVNRMPDNVKTVVYESVSEISNSVSAFIGKGSNLAMDFLSDAVKQVPMVIFSIIVCILSAYFFVADKRDFSKAYQEKCPDKIKSTVSLVVNGVKHAVGGYFVAQIKIELFVYACLLIGFLLLKVNFAWLVALGIAILDFLPVFGTGTAIVPWSIIEAINGNYFTALLLLVIWGLSQLLRQLLQPKFVSNQVGLSEFSTLFLLYTGFVLGGVLGMILSLPIGIVIVSFYKEGVFNAYINEWKQLFLLIKKSTNVEDIRQ